MDIFVLIDLFLLILKISTEPLTTKWISSITFFVFDLMRTYKTNEPLTTRWLVACLPHFFYILFIFFHTVFFNHYIRFFHLPTYW